MTRNLDTLKDHAPGTYWRAVDMATSGATSVEIMRQITREVVRLNHERAEKNLPAIALSWVS